MKIVLAIDDNLMQLDMYAKMLSGKYDVKTAGSASEALNILNSSKADVILLDIEMPDVSGFDLYNDIRKIPDCAGTPIIIVSGNSDPEFLEKAGKTGAFCVMIKPVKLGALAETIGKALV